MSTITPYRNKSLSHLAIFPLYRKNYKMTEIGLILKRRQTIDPIKKGSRKSAIVSRGNGLCFH